MIERDPIDPFQTDAWLDDPSPAAGWGGLGRLLRDLKTPGLPSELGDEGTVVAQMRVAVAASVAAAPAGPRRLTRKVVGLAVVGSVAFGGVAAAAGVPVPLVGEVIDEIFSPGPDPVLDEAPARSGSGQTGGPIDETPPAQEGPQSPPEGAGADGAQLDDGEVGEAGSSEQPGSSGRARTDCGKRDVEPTGDPECDDADNHGGFVNGGNGNNDEDGNGHANGGTGKSGKSGDPNGNGVAANDGKGDGAGLDGNKGNGSGNRAAGGESDDDDGAPRASGGSWGGDGNGSSGNRAGNVSGK